MRRLIFAAALALPMTAHAQLYGGGGFPISPAYRSPFTFINPTPYGGYTAWRPGESPTFINPDGNGGYIVQTPAPPPVNILGPLYSPN